MSTCKTCRYFQVSVDDSRSECRYNAPMSYVRKHKDRYDNWSEETTRVWPRVRESDWCGRYRHGAEMILKISEETFVAEVRALCNGKNDGQVHARLKDLGYTLVREVPPAQRQHVLDRLKEATT